MASYSDNLQDSLNAVTPVASPGTTGSTIDLGATTTDYVLYVVNTAGSGNATTTWSGSLDGTNWYSVPSGSTSAQVGTVPARYLRATSSLNSGSPAITAAVAVVE